MPGMALIVFLRGVNVGGHRTFRPSIVARELSDYDVLNVGAAGTFVVRKPGSRAKFRTALLRKLPFEAEIVLCDGRDLMRLETENPFGAWPVCCPCPHHPVAGALRVSVTAHPTAEWTGQQLREAFPFDQLPRYLLRDRDAIFGLDFREQVRDMGIQEVLSTPRSPWQRAYVEGMIGSIRREGVD